MPQWRASRARRQVAAFRIAAGIAEPHRQDRDPALVVEAFAVEPQPKAQPVAAFIVERQAGLVNAGSRRLADDQQTSRRSTADDGSRAQRQMGGTDRAAADFRE